MFAEFLYLPTGTANIFLTLPINVNVFCSKLGDLNLMRLFSFLRVGWFINQLVPIQPHPDWSGTHPLIGWWPCNVFCCTLTAWNDSLPSPPYCWRDPCQPLRQRKLIGLMLKHVLTWSTFGRQHLRSPSRQTLEASRLRLKRKLASVSWRCRGVN